MAMAARKGRGHGCARWPAGNQGFCSRDEGVHCRMHRTPAPRFQPPCGVQSNLSYGWGGTESGVARLMNAVLRASPDKDIRFLWVDGVIASPSLPLQGAATTITA